MRITQELLNEINDDSNLLQSVITSDESWVYGYGIQTKAQSFQWRVEESKERK